ncbi:MAG TPA: hypothetical protein PK961_14485 [bacterium]|nr:hypothetical protein [bacterium]
MKIATLDIGSNTVRLLLGTVEKGVLKRVSVDRKITRLAGKFAAGRAHPDSLQRTVEAVAEFARKARAYGAVEIRAVCTGVARRLEDPLTLLDALAEQARLDAQIIDGRLEAAVSALGGAYETGLRDRTFLLMDVGGFSTELALVENARPARAVSLDFGAVSLTENHLLDDPPTVAQLQSGAQAVAELLASNEELAQLPAVDTLVGTAGTVTTLAALDLKMERYDPEQIDGRILSVATIEGLLAKLVSMPAAERLYLPGLEKGREDLIPAGAIICLRVMEHLHFERLAVTEGGVLEGVALWPQWPLG